MRLSFQEIASRITGVSIPVFGVSWTPPEADRKVVRDVIVFLEDRRALYNDFAHEIETEVAQSVLRIREELTEAIKRLSDNSEATTSLRAMRAAAREYLDKDSSRYPRYFNSMLELGKLRTTFGFHIAYLAVKYGINIEERLSSIVPQEFKERI